MDEDDVSIDDMKLLGALEPASNGGEDVVLPGLRLCQTFRQGLMCEDDLVDLLPELIKVQDKQEGPRKQSPWLPRTWLCVFMD